MANNTVLMCLCRLCVQTFVTLSKCRINSKWVIANRSEVKQKKTFFFLSRIDKKCLSAFTIDNIMTTARKSNIRKKRKDTKDEKKKNISQEIQILQRFHLFYKSRKCWLSFWKSAMAKVWKLHMKKLPPKSLNHVRKCMWPVSFALLLLLRQIHTILLSMSFGLPSIERV